MIANDRILGEDLAKALPVFMNKIPGDTVIGFSPAPGARRVSVVSLEPGTHAMTNFDVDDGTDFRIRLVRSSLRPEDFLTSAGQLCRDPRVLISGGERGTVSSSLVFA